MEDTSNKPTVPTCAFEVQFFQSVITPLIDISLLSISNFASCISNISHTNLYSLKSSSYNHTPRCIPPPSSSSPSSSSPLAPLAHTLRPIQSRHLAALAPPSRRAAPPLGARPVRHAGPAWRRTAHRGTRGAAPRARGAAAGACGVCGGGAAPDVRRDSPCVGLLCYPGVERRGRKGSDVYIQRSLEIRLDRFAPLS